MYVRTQKLLFLQYIIDPQYDNVLVFELPVQFMKTASSERSQNMLCTQIGFCFCFDIQNNLCTQHVLRVFWKKIYLYENDATQFYDSLNSYAYFHLYLD